MSELKNTPKAEREAAKAARARLELGRKMTLEQGEAPFEIEGNFETFEAKAKVLASTKDASEAELSFVLYTLRGNRGFLDKHYATFDDYVEAEIKISRSKASGLVQAWGHFIDLGLPVTLLGGENRISWSKFRLLRPAIKAGIITSDSIYEWLPYIKATGAESLRDKDIESRVRRQMGLSEKEAAKKDFVVMKMQVPNDKIEAVMSYHDVVATATGLEEQSSHYVMAMEHLFARITSNEMEAAKAAGLANLKKAAESIVPGLTVVFLAPDAEQYSYDALGVDVAHSVYQGVKESGGKKEIVHVLASSDEEAEEILGKNYRKYPLTVSAALKGTVKSPQVAEETPPEEATDTQEEKSEKVGILTDYVEKLYKTDLELIDSESKASIIKKLAKELIVAKIISEDGYNQRVKQMKTEYSNQRQLVNAVAKWVIELAYEAKL